MTDHQIKKCQMIDIRQDRICYGTVIVIGDADVGYKTWCQRCLSRGPDRETEEHAVEDHNYMMKILQNERMT